MQFFFFLGREDILTQRLETSVILGKDLSLFHTLKALMTHVTNRPQQLELESLGIFACTPLLKVYQSLNLTRNNSVNTLVLGGCSDKQVYTDGVMLCWRSKAEKSLPHTVFSTEVDTHGLPYW